LRDNIKLDFSVEREKASRSTCINEVPAYMLGQSIMLGSVEFCIGDEDFGNEDEQILDFSIDAVKMLQKVAFLRGSARGCFLEYDVDLIFSMNEDRANDIIVKLGTASKVLREAHVPMSDLMRSLGEFHFRVVTEALRRHSDLAKHEGFLDFCPFAKDIIKNFNSALKP